MEKRIKELEQIELVSPNSSSFYTFIIIDFSKRSIVVILNPDSRLI